MRLKTLNGAPLRANLDFSPEALLPLETAARFPFQPRIQSEDSTEDLPLKWRHITPRNQRLKSDWSEPYLPNSAFQGSDPDVTFAIPGVGASLDTEQDTTNFDTTMIQEDNELDEEFVYHSLIFNNTLLSSQIVDAAAIDQSAASQSFLDTSMDSTSSFATHSLQQSNADGPILQIPLSLNLTTLGALPDAAHLRRIYPQTPTPNLLCVLAASPEDRVVITKKGGYKMRLCEIIVADDTRSSFKISFWQRTSSASEPHNALERTLQSIKTGDVLLLRNVALNAFHDDVYGQSLNPSITRVRTSIEVLMSSSGISSRQLAALPAPVAATFTRVKKWANTHIASHRTVQKKRSNQSQRDSMPNKRVLRSSSRHDETLPPDTMEST